MSQETKVESKNDSNKINEPLYRKEVLYKSAKTILDFLETLKFGNSFWIDQENQKHICDMGYVFEFFDDFMDTYKE